MLKEEDIRKLRKKIIDVKYKTVDTCAAEFEAYTPYYYSTYHGEEDEIAELENKRQDKREKIIVFGSGPNRIGQGVEFDYCCVHSVWAIKEEGYKSIMVNCNPETVSTDYDTSDKLFFEPITIESALNLIEKENPKGVIVQFGGQTPLKLATSLEKEKVNILGTSPRSIDIAEDRELFRRLLEKLGLKQPPSATATSILEAIKIASQIGYPVLIRPSYVLGGRAMKVVYNEEELISYMQEGLEASEEKPVLIDKFLEDAIELDVDAICDGKDVLIGGIMEHIEEAGIHSGDSACVIPSFSLKKDILDDIKRQTAKLALALKVKGLINVQFAVQNDQIYVIEANPRASRTVPFVSKAVGVPLAKLATKVALGKSIKDLIKGYNIQVFENIGDSIIYETQSKMYAIKESVFPWNRFPQEDPILGPEMKSTGEVMGIDKDLGLAFYKSQLAAGFKLPKSGTVFISVKDKDKPKVINIAKKLVDLGFKLVATQGTYKFLKEHGIEVKKVYKVYEGQRPNILDLIKNKEIHLIINTPSGKTAQKDAISIRRLAVNYNIPYYTTIRSAQMVVLAIESLKTKKLKVYALQDINKS